MEDTILQFIADIVIGNGLVIAVAAFILGKIIKSSIKFIKNDYIPLIGGVLGIVLGIFIPGMFGNVDVITKGIYGLGAGWAATGGYETVKNLIAARKAAKEAK